MEFEQPLPSSASLHSSPEIVVRTIQQVSPVLSTTTAWPTTDTGEHMLGSGALPENTIIESKLTLLEHRFELNETALSQSENKVELLSGLLQSAKESIQCLGEEADNECQHLQCELEAKETELAVVLNRQSQDPSWTSPDSGVPVQILPTLDHLRALNVALAQEAAGLRREVCELREGEVANAERQTLTYQELMAHAASLRAGVERAELQHSPAGPSVGRRDVRAEVDELQERCGMYEQGLHSQLAVVAQAEEEVSVLREFCAEEIRGAALARESATSAHENAELQTESALSAISLMEASSSDAENRYDTLKVENEQLHLRLLDASAGREVAQQAADEALAERDNLRDAVESAELTAQAGQQELHEARRESEIAQQRLGGVNSTFDCELQLELERRTRDLRSELGAESMACRAAQDSALVEARACQASAGRLDRTLSTPTARWLQLILQGERVRLEERLTLCKASWKLGASRKSARCMRLSEELQTLAATPAHPKVVQELERQCEQGERRLAALEQLHADHTKRAYSVTRAAAAEFQEAQRLWQGQLEELNITLREEVSIAKSAKAEATQAAMQKRALVEELHQLKSETICAKTNDDVCSADLQAEVERLRKDLSSAEEAIGMLVAGGSVGGDGGGNLVDEAG